MIRHCFLVITCVIICFAHWVNGCHSLKNVEVYVHQRNGDPFTARLNGCIERKAFEENNVVTEALIKEQDIGTLGKDSVRNMARLSSVSITECHLTEIAAGAFRNVPRLKYVEISYCPLTEIQANIFNVMPEISRLNLTHNQISKVRDAGFANIPTLIAIYLHHNNLEDWKTDWFANTTSLTVIDFRYNKIKSLPRRAFSSFKKAKRIYFDFNDISVINKEAFKGLTKLEELGLRHNKLTQIDVNVFPNTLQIDKLLLDANHLNFLSNALFDKLTVKSVSVYGNPWKCPCLDVIHRWLHKTNASLVRAEPCDSNNIPVCGASKAGSAKCDETVDNEITLNYLEALGKLPQRVDKCAKFE